MCILVYDPSLKDIDAPFYLKLREEGFTRKHKFWGMYWVFVYLDTMEYACGMPGVKMGKPYGNHAVTIDEFWAIYYALKSVYSKYKGLPVLEFNKGGE